MHLTLQSFLRGVLVWACFAQVLKVCVEVSRGMDYLHQRKIIHRDLKAANLLLDENGTVSILQPQNQFVADKSVRQHDVRSTRTLYLALCGVACSLAAGTCAVCGRVRAVAQPRSCVACAVALACCSFAWQRWVLTSMLLCCARAGQDC